MLKSFFTTICLALVAYAANAQTITDELRRKVDGQGKVVINQSADIERLVNNVSTTTTPKPVSQTTGTTTQKTVAQTTTATTPVGSHTTDKPAATAEKPNTAERPSAEKPTAEKPNAERPSERPAAASPAAPTPSSSNTEAESEIVNTNKKIMRHSYKTTGYRIQVYSGGNKREDRQKCEQISARLKASFPNLPIYVHFYSPSWKCRAGNFTDQGEAKSMLKQIRAMGYTQACLVKGTINVQY